MSKATDLYSECVDVLDNVQATVLELLESGYCEGKDKWYVLEMAINIVRDYESLSPEVKDAMMEIEDSVKDGEITIEEALELVTNVESNNKACNSNKRLLN